MLFIGSYLQKADNSGVKTMRCVNVLRGSFCKTAHLGNIIRVVAKKIYPHKKVARKKQYNALIINIKRKTRRKGGIFIKFDQNKAVLLNEKNKFLGSRVFGPICKEIRGGSKEMRFKKIISHSRACI